MGRLSDEEKAAALLVDDVGLRGRGWLVLLSETSQGKTWCWMSRRRIDPPP